ncbi:hypothetical protein EYF80_037606 [Liparis tanakae]|uniref:Uncharacterized protein n=1 Tax=Liparis tanakae TaxID=230148 RepID=A0A4Z2GF68_9TELE|nr:hypothetical protein EYF80_037606 [Liparis tanakae]
MTSSSSFFLWSKWTSISVCSSSSSSSGSSSCSSSASGRKEDPDTTTQTQRAPCDTFLAEHAGQIDRAATGSGYWRRLKNLGVT